METLGKCFGKRLRNVMKKTWKKLEIDLEKQRKKTWTRLVKRLELGFRKAQKKTGKQSWKDFENDLDGKTCKKTGKKNWKDLEKKLERLEKRT